MGRSFSQCLPSAGAAQSGRAARQAENHWEVDCAGRLLGTAAQPIAVPAPRTVPAPAERVRVSGVPAETGAAVIYYSYVDREALLLYDAKGEMTAMLGSCVEQTFSKPIG